MSYQTVPRHSPADVIKSEEWNIIADDLDYLNDRLEEISPKVGKNVLITGASTINAGESSEYAVGCSNIVGRTRIPMDGKLERMKVRCESNSLDADMTITLKKNGEDTDLKLTLSAGSLSGSKVAEVEFSEDDELSIYVDASSATSGSVANLVVALY